MLHVWNSLSASTLSHRSNYTHKHALTSNSVCFNVQICTICIGGIIVEPPSCGSSNQGSLVGVGRDTAYIDSNVDAIQVCCRVQGPPDSTVTWFLNNAPIDKRARGYTFLDEGFHYTGPMNEGCVTYTCQANISMHLPLVEESARICFGSKFLYSKI